MHGHRASNEHLLLEVEFPTQYMFATTVSMITERGEATALWISSSL